MVILRQTGPGELVRVSTDTYKYDATDFPEPQDRFEILPNFGKPLFARFYDSRLPLPKEGHPINSYNSPRNKPNSGQEWRVGFSKLAIRKGYRQFLPMKKFNGIEAIFEPIDEFSVSDLASEDGLTNFGKDYFNDHFDKEAMKPYMEKAVRRARLEGIEASEQVRHLMAHFDDVQEVYIGPLATKIPNRDNSSTSPRMFPSKERHEKREELLASLSYAKPRIEFIRYWNGFQTGGGMRNPIVLWYVDNNPRIRPENLQLATGIKNNPLKMIARTLAERGLLSQDENGGLHTTEEFKDEVFAFKESEDKFLQL